ncbi:phage tail protein [Vibrio antiquarius]|uniref:phage tail protein n=1 Tax=Vibrio antiquarius (strain Ex25) TaxID=150340 RepID=UPI00265CF2D7|nr:phage tail protein [Vibrio antiquarius]MCR9686212.1 phage tail protein [Vibrio antiquarius]
MANTTDKSILTAAGKALLAQLNAEEKPLIIDKMIFANVPNRPEFPQPDDVVPTDDIVHQEQVEQRGRLSADSVIYSTTLTSDVGPFEFNWTGAYCSEYGVLVTVDHHALTPKTADEPGVAGNTLVRSVVLEYKDIAEITNITVDASSWQYNATDRMKKMDSDVAQSIIDQNGKDWFIEDGFLVTPSGSAYIIKAGAGYVSGNRVSMEFDRSVQVPNKPSFIYIDAHREGTPTGEQVTLFDFVITAEEKDDYIDSSTGKDIPHFVCKIAEVLADGSVSDLRRMDKNLESLRAKGDAIAWGAVGDGVADDTEICQRILDKLGFLHLTEGKIFKTNGITPKMGDAKLTGKGKFLYTKNNVLVETTYKSNSTRKNYIYTWQVNHIEELLHIKSLGFNTIIHYGYYNNGGNIEQTLYCCNLVDVDVMLYSLTDNPVLPYDNNKNIVGYVLFEEPANNGVSVSSQETRIAAHRLKTNKNLCVVDSGDFGAGVKVWAKGYDVFFFDFYAPTESTYEENKLKVHICLAQILSQVKNATVIPCLGLFTSDVDGFGNESNQITLAKKFFNISKDSSFAVFGWDPSSQSENFTGDVLNTPSYQKLAIDLCSKVSSAYTFEYHLFSPADNTNLHPMGALVSLYDSNYSYNAKPFSVIDAGSMINERQSTFADKGIGVSQDDAFFATRIVSKNYMVARLEYRNYIDSTKVTVSGKLFDDDFYNATSVMFTNQLSNLSAMTKGIEVADNYLFGLSISCEVSDTKHWKFLDGYFINSEWEN